MDILLERFPFWIFPHLQRNFMIINRILFQNDLFWSKNWNQRIKDKNRTKIFKEANYPFIKRISREFVLHFSSPFFSLSGIIVIKSPFFFVFILQEISYSKNFNWIIKFWNVIWWFWLTEGDNIFHPNNKIKF